MNFCLCLGAALSPSCRISSSQASSHLRMCKQRKRCSAIFPERAKRDDTNLFFCNCESLVAINALCRCVGSIGPYLEKEQRSSALLDLANRFGKVSDSILPVDCCRDPFALAIRTH